MKGNMFEQWTKGGFVSPCIDKNILNHIASVKPYKWHEEQSNPSILFWKMSSVKC